MKKILKKKWHIILYFIFLFVTFFFLYQTKSSDENYYFTRYDRILFTEPWKYVFSDGTEGTTELPAQLEAGDVDTLTLKNQLPEVSDGTEFIYRSRHTKTKIYIGGELVYDQMTQTNEKDEVGETWFPLPGIVWDEVPLSAADSNKEIRIELTGVVKNYLKGPGEVYLGDRASFLLKLMEERRGTFIGATLLMLLSVILLILWVTLVITTRTTYRDCLCLALFTASVSLWEFTETRCMQFFVPNMKTVGILAYEILALTPVPIALYYSYGRRKRTARLSKIAAVIALAVWFGNNMLHFLHIADISETLIVTQILNVFEVMFLGYVQISDIIYDSKEEKNSIDERFWWIPLIGLGILVPLLLLELFRYMFGIGRHRDDIVFTNIGMIAYIVSLAFSSVMKLVSENLRANEASAAKSQFLANMSHEIRTPLSAVLGFDELILRDAKDEKILQYAANIQSAGTSLRDIINAVLDLTKIESGKMEMLEAEYCTVQFLDNVCSMVKALADEKGLYFKVEIDEKLPERLWGDETHIRQVLINLMTNAVKYTREGGVVFKVQMAEEADDDGVCRILFSVKDTGIGIREEDRERLFEKFERLDYEKNRNVEGTGLGMSIVVKLLEAMDSKIELKSVYGKGSEFYFVLPQKVVGESRVGNYESGRNRELPEQDKESYMAPSARILIVDDVALNLQVACGLLEGLKMQIDTAESGLQALDFVKENRYDVILMDHMMPGMDGIEVTKKIRELAKITGDEYYKKVPVLALTANALSGMKEKFLEEGLQDFIGKPVEGKELIRILRKWLPKEKIVLNDKNISEDWAVEKVEEAEWEIQIPGLDVAAAKVYAPEKEMYLETLRAYLIAIPGTKERIEKFTREKDSQNYIITVHGLKSASKLVGAMEISELAKQLEETASNGNCEEAWEKTPHLLELYKNCEEAIQKYFSETEEKAELVLSEEEMKELLSGLKSAAEEFDMEAFLDWEKRMECVQVEEAYQEKWHEILTAVQNLAFTDVIEKIEQI